MSTTLDDSKAYSIGKYERKAKFVNPKIVTNVPGPGHHDPMDIYTTKMSKSS